MDEYVGELPVMRSAAALTDTFSTIERLRAEVQDQGKKNGEIYNMIKKLSVTQHNKAEKGVPEDNATNGNRVGVITGTRLM